MLLLVPATNVVRCSEVSLLLSRSEPALHRCLVQSNKVSFGLFLWTAASRLVHIPTGQCCVLYHAEFNLYHMHWSLSTS